MKVWIVDDLPENLKAAEDAVKEYYGFGVEVKTFASAKEIISELRGYEEAPCDLVLTDMNMEEKMSGYFVAKEAGGVFGIPTVCVSGGIAGHGGDMVAVGNGKLSLTGDKDDKNIWLQMLEYMEESLYLQAMKRSFAALGSKPVGERRLDDEWQDTVALGVCLNFLTTTGVERLLCHLKQKIKVVRGSVRK